MKGPEGFSHPGGLALAEKLVSVLRKPDFLQFVYPAMFLSGIPEGSLHAFMLSSLVLVGDRLGYSPVCDTPVFDYLDNLLLGEGSKRPDSVWYERGSSAIRALVEFERYQSVALERKVRNLLIMANTCRLDINLLVLIYWTNHIRTFADLEPACKTIIQGFEQNESRFTFANCPFLILETFVKQVELGVCITSFIARKYFYRGENKPYIIDYLNAL